MIGALLDNLLAPSPAPGRVAFLKGQPYAHRGLHGNGVLENSPAAFDAAIRLGHGIECDVQAAEDGRAFVFHDYELDRLTERTGLIGKLRPEDIDQIQLKDGHGKIPRLRETLVQVAGQVPILIEIKSRNRRVGPLCLSDIRDLPSRFAIAQRSRGLPVVSWTVRSAEQERVASRYADEPVYEIPEN